MSLFAQEVVSLQLHKSMQTLISHGEMNQIRSVLISLFVQEVVSRGVVDPERVAVGGHSYGAFMAANLLAGDTEGLFACGIAQSGAYNRTLTPFGFQSEQRTLWQAPETYHAMSPFLQVQ